ncbi:protein TPX2 isoform X1 [Cinnamomum micranthum f. kanehirae]|uniref:Protein TPX2 isoform X1 n=1 Tax=Cinnamomum micranthum f. kanehirae TaxID=337451 RepID=A0A443PEW3_9MAGN|nr:protein TPX2 isoform X1 [Cinnamomum micranthum f. kanehirae]
MLGEEMDEEMEDVFQKSFQCLEIDLEYEFDASRFFDFTRPESLAAAQAAELWFETAASYPPSPFIAKLNLREDVVIRNSNVFSNPNDVEHSNPITTYSEIDMEPRFSVPKENGGWIFPDQITKGMSIAKTRSVFKAPFSSGSTLMKPTASQLAKQNRPREIKGPRQFIQRLQKPLVQKNEGSLENPSKNESQASKRQRLAGGQSWKDEPIHDSTEQCRLKLTIPRGPELILEAPSMLLPQKSTPRIPKYQEFDLKTSKRATQHLSTASSSLSCSINSDNVVHKHKSDFLKKLDTKDTKTSQHQDHIPSQPQKRMLNDDLRLEENETIPKFKARPLNKKILLSKGDIGVFRTSKRETTVPREFTFMTEKRFRQNPPVELFNKLSLTSEPKQNTVSQSTANQPFLRPVKISYE